MPLEAKPLFRPDVLAPRLTAFTLPADVAAARPKLAAEALALEHKVSDLVNEAYGLTPAEIRLMWDTAPPRMPIPRPAEG